MTRLDATALASILAPKRPLIYVLDTKTVGDALALLHENDLRALPLATSHTALDTTSLPRATAAAAPTGFTRLVTVAELVAHVIRSLSRPLGDTSPPVTDPKVRALLVRGALNTPVREALAGLDPELGRDDNLLSVIVETDQIDLQRLLDKLYHGVKRVLVHTETQIKLFTQTDVLRYLSNMVFHQPHSKLAELFRTPIGELRSDTFIPRKYPMLTVPAEAPIEEALELLVMSQVDAVPVVDFRDAEWTEFAPPSSTLSVSDVRCLNDETALLLFDLKETVESFLRRTRGSARPAEPLTCTAQEHLGTVILRMLNAHVHRVWFCNSSGSVEACLSYTDVIRVVIDSMSGIADWSALTIHDSPTRHAIGRNAEY